MIIVSIVSLCISGLLVLEAIIRKQDFFSPIRIYLFFHSMALGIAFLGFHPAMTPFRPFTSLVYFGSTACFLVGAWVVQMLDGSTKKELADSKPLNFSRYNWNLHFIFALALFAFFVVATAVLYFSSGQLPLFAPEKVKAQKAFFSQRWIFIYGYTFGGIVMALFSISIYRPRRLPKILNLGFWMTLITVFIFSVALERSALMFFILFVIVFYHYGFRKIPIWKLSSFFLICFTLILVTGYLKATSIQEQHRNYFKKPSEVLFIALRVPYFYIANNFWNLDYALNLPNFREDARTTYGLSVLEGLTDGVPMPGGTLGDQIRRDTHIDNQFNTRAAKVTGLNTISYQWSWYKDFGVAGVFFGPFLIGMMINALYLRMLKKKTILNLAMYSYIAYWMANSYFGSIFETPTYFYGFIYLSLCCYLCQRLFLEKPVSHSGLHLILDEGLA